jgi:PIN domain nuclease of toxin-antitoxin system
MEPKKTTRKKEKEKLVSLYKTDKIKLSDCESARDVLDKVKIFDIEIVYYNKYHLSKYVELDLVEDHKDMNDHAIIAQAISDKISLISSDTKFHDYTAQGLDFVFNKR